jgi:Holliday junction resolvasome RuvABC endonuclease subunit
MKVLGIDLGTDSTGWVVLETRKTMTTPICLAAGSFNCSHSTYEGSGMRPFRFRMAAEALLLTHQPDVVVYEDVRRHEGTAAAHVYGMLKNALLEVCEWRSDSLEGQAMAPGEPVPVTCIGVGTWKNALLGNGRASKKQVAEVVERMHCWPWRPHLAGVRYPFDVTDAAGIALGWLRHEHEEGSSLCLSKSSG